MFMALGHSTLFLTPGQSMISQLVAMKRIEAPAQKDLPIVAPSIKYTKPA